MSLVLAIKDKDRFVIGADKQASTGLNKNHTATKIWEAPDFPDVVFGGVGSVRATQIIQYASIIDKNCLKDGFSTEFIVCNVVPTLVHALEVNGINCSTSDEPGDEHKTKMMPNTFIIAYKDRAWVIWNDLSVIEIEDYFAIGSGSDVAKGALFATRGKNPFERIVTSIDAASESTLFVDNGIDLLATKYYESDEAAIGKALGIEEAPTKKAKKSSKEKK